MNNIKIIDIMNYPTICFPDTVDLNQWDEFKEMAKTTFKSMFPSGRYPVTVEERKQHSRIYGTQFNPYGTLEEMFRDIEENNYDYVCLNATKMWSYRRHFKLIFDFTNEQIKEVVEESNGKIIGGAGYNPFRIEESLKDMEIAVKEYGFKFAFCHPMSFGLTVDDKKCYPLYAKCNELNIPVYLHVGTIAIPLPSWVGNPINIDQVAIDFPNLRINLSHTGWPWIDEWCSMLFKHANVFGDISGYYPKGLDNRIIDSINKKVPDKVLFGTAGFGFKKCREQFLSLDISDEIKKKVLRDNSLRFLGIG